MKKLFLAPFLLGLAMVVGCGGDDGGAGGAGANGGGSNCFEYHACSNGACTCTQGPKDGQSCCDPDDGSCTENKCDTFCEYCE
jgi:hypothetical protein